jgi:hypothetical protein
MSDLRRRLHTITENKNPPTHRQLISDLGNEFEHSIAVVDGPAPDIRYNCVQHALHLIEDPEYVAIVNAAPADIFASPLFVQRLIEHGNLVDVGAPLQSALVVYFEGDAVMHIGRMLSEVCVESKWGTGHLYHHGIFEVPINYGSVTRFFEPVTRDFVLDRYVEYAKENGVEFVDEPHRAA